MFFYDLEDFKLHNGDFIQYTSEPRMAPNQWRVVKGGHLYHGQEFKSLKSQELVDRGRVQCVLRNPYDFKEMKYEPKKAQKALETKLEEGLFWAFTWRDTPQGDAFWRGKDKLCIPTLRNMIKIFDIVKDVAPELLTTEQLA